MLFRSMETIITDPSSFFFPRSSQAELYADGLQRGGIVNLSSGLFLAAPAGTGKTTFLTRDLMPELARRDVIAIYVDLSDGGAIAWLYRTGEVLERRDDEQMAHLTVGLDASALARFETAYPYRAH